MAVKPRLSAESRRAALAELLRTRAVKTVGEAALTLGVSIRTIHYDVKTMQSDGLPVVCSRGRRGGISWPNTPAISDGVSHDDTWLISTRTSAALQIDQLSPEMRTFLLRAAVIGDQFDFIELESAFEWDVAVSPPVQLIADAGHLGILRSNVDTIGGFQFSSEAILRQILSESDPKLIATVNRNFADWLIDNRSNAPAASERARIALHYARSYPFFEPDAAIEESLASGDQHLEEGEHSEAKGCFEMALHLPGSASDRGRACFGMARCLESESHGESAREIAQIIQKYLVKAFEHFFEAGDTASAVEVIAYRPPSFLLQTGTANFIGTAISELSRNSDPDPTLLSRLASATFFDGHEIQAAVDIATEAVKRAHQHSNTQAEVQGVANLGLFALHTLRFDEAIEHSDRVRSLPLKESRDLFSPNLIDIFSGRFETVRHSLHEWTNAGSTWAPGSYWHEVVTGSIALGTGTGLDDDAAMHISHRALLAAIKGDHKLATTLVDSSIDQLGRSEVLGARAGIGLTLALACRLAGCVDHSNAIRELALGSENWTPLLERSVSSCLMMCGVLETSARDEQSELFDLSELQDRFALYSGFPYSVISGIFEKSRGRWKSAAGHFRYSLSIPALAEDSPARFLALTELAELVGQKDSGVTRNSAIRMASSALNKIRKLGFAGFEGRLGRSVQIANRMDAFDPSGNIFGVTGRELEVMRLVADDHDDPAICDRLVISIHTIRSHVRSTLNKTGTTSRAAAIAALSRAGLL